ncbi:MAG: hypothetical protein K0S32_2522 [Bacteroidetes bacterium]|nr:hypothetical protein [Bacteroidota bacterium]
MFTKINKVLSEKISPSASPLKHVMKKALTFLFLLFAGIVSSQDIKIKKATCHTWAMGYCCKHGVNYHISFSTNVVAKKFVVDTIWINGNYFIPKVSGKEIKSDAMYSYNFEKTWDNRKSTKEEMASEKQVTPPEFDGAILMIYRVNGVKKKFIVKQFTKQTMTANP